MGAYSNGLAAVRALAHADVLRGSWVRRSVHSFAKTCAPFSLSIFGLSFALALASCAIGPEYSREPAPVPVEYKETEGWKVANPSDDVDRGDWWTVYRDRGLDTLLPQVEISNQTVAASAAAYEQARALIREAQASLFPTVTAGYNATRTRTGSLAGSGTSAASSGGFGPSRHDLFDDLCRADHRQPGISTSGARSAARSRATPPRAQASAADLDNAKLSAQAALATAYFNLRCGGFADRPAHPHDRRIQKKLTIVHNQFKAGFSVTDGDVATADAQIATTRRKRSMSMFSARNSNMPSPC